MENWFYIGAISFPSGWKTEFILVASDTSTVASDTSTVASDTSTGSQRQVNW
ncbi:MAG: hypothetical protein ILA06_02915 [Bacteroidaceae bacterium]|nr:hypothetical protein [Bacteroidaceae bacterium]